MAGRKRSYEMSFKIKVTNLVVQFHAQDSHRLRTSPDVTAASMSDTHTHLSKAHVSK